MSNYSFKEYIKAWPLYSRSSYSFLHPSGGLFPARLFRSFRFKIEEYIEHPNYFKPSGLLTFHGSQGQGKTLTAAAVYCHQLLQAYPCCILCTNTRFKDRPFNAYVWHEDIPLKELKSRYKQVKEQRIDRFYDEVIEQLKSDFLSIKYPEYTEEDYILKNIEFYYFNETSDFESFRQEQCFQLRDIMSDEVITPELIESGRFKNVTVEYWGLDSLKYINNGKLGVLYFIDEIQLEFNNLDKSIPVEIMVEVSQQRKQRKHIVGTSQCFKRSAKFLREQTHDAVACRCFFGLIQFNKLIDGESIDEDASGKLKYKTKRFSLFFHDVDLYNYYDTYAKMKRYNNEWQGRPVVLQVAAGG